MATRVNGEEVKDILDTILTATDLIPFIAAANLIVTNHVDNGDVGAATLTEIERWLAAHLACQRDKRAAKEGETDVTYEAPNLESSSYGAQALLMDPTGELAKLSAGDRRRGMFRVTGA
jgi:hypothetical protein